MPHASGGTINLYPQTRSTPMHISAAARHTGLSAKQIRDYEKRGLLTPATRSAAGYRSYDSADLARLHFIRHARAVGFSLQQIATLLRLQENPARHAGEVKALTAAHIATLRAQIGDLQAMVAELQRWHDACHGDDTPACAILDGLQQDEPQGCD